ncbi:MAG: hypothetical protein QG608_2461 [Actinomycetota bacterium]|nr:hypothetical protein [Actinomycetota bacterium]
MTAAQILALGHARDVAALTARVAQLRTANVLRSVGLDLALPDIVDAVRERARVTVHFHPDRFLPAGGTVVCSLAEEGWYRNQFETGITNGGIPVKTAAPRDREERELFADAYLRAGVRPGDRPKYGALDFVGAPEGATPEFGPCHLRLRPLVLPRCTFSLADGHRTRDTGTWHLMDSLVAGLLEAARGESVPGGDRLPGEDVRRLLGMLLDTGGLNGTAGGRNSAEAPSAQGTGGTGGIGGILPPSGDLSPVRVDAQVHGEILLSRDVDRLVADPSYRGTAVEEELAQIRDRYELDLHWHRGFALPFEKLQALCGESLMSVLARQVHREFADGAPCLTAAIIGRATAAIHRDPLRWADWGSPTHSLSLLGQLWRVVVRHGLLPVP